MRFDYQAIGQRWGIKRLMEQTIAFGASDVLIDRGANASCPRGEILHIPIRMAAQREVLDRAHQLAGQGSLIPADRTYIQHLKVYERHTANAGLHKLHGLRHAYAQQRYMELTGWVAPAAGGPTSEAITPEQKAHDREARLIISRGLGHEREQITAVYLGR